MFCCALVCALGSVSTFQEIRGSSPKVYNKRSFSHFSLPFSLSFLSVSLPFSLSFLPVSLPFSLPHLTRLVAYEYLTTDGPRVLISTNFVYLIKQTPPTASDVEAKIPLEILHHCRDTTSRGDGGENGAIQYNAIHCNAIQCNIMQYNAMQYNTMQYNTMQYNTMQYNTTQYNAMQYNTVQCYGA